VAIKDYKITANGSSFLMENLKDDPVKLINITAELTNGTMASGNFNPSGVKLIQGESRVFTVSEITCNAGLDYEIGNVTILYDVVKGISGQTEISIGIKPIIGQCPS
jgi:hypothetical protein